MPRVKWQCSTCSPCEQHQAGTDWQQEGWATLGTGTWQSTGKPHSVGKPPAAASLEVKQPFQNSTSKAFIRVIDFFKSFHSGIMFLSTVLWDHLQHCQRGGRNIFSKGQAQVPVAAPWEGPQPPGADLNREKRGTGRKQHSWPLSRAAQALAAPGTEDNLHDRPVRDGCSLKVSLPWAAGGMSEVLSTGIFYLMLDACTTQTFLSDFPGTQQRDDHLSPSSLLGELY